MIAPSILSCDFTNIREDFEAMNRARADFVHVDVMDGAYVPNISFGPSIISQLRNLTDIKFDTHLMIESPERYVEDFKSAGVDILTIHPDSTRHLNRTINLIKNSGMKVGLALNPAESIEVLDYTIEDIDLVLVMSVNPGFGGQSFIESSLRKIKAIRELIEGRNLKTLIEVDGGVKLNNASKIIDAGADILVAGSAVFDGHAYENILEFKELMK